MASQVAEENIVISVNGLYMMFCTALLPVVLIGIALFYSGLTQRRSSLTMLSVPIILTPLIFIDWFIWGYSLCYSKSSNGFIGNLDKAVLRNLREPDQWTVTNSRGEVLTVIHFLFNAMFKVICAGFTFPGCIAERGRIIPMLVFVFFWSVIIYNPITYWFWGGNGWLSIDLDKLPVLDFAGGTCIHVVSGATALAYSYILGPRNPKILYNYRNSNTGYVILGTLFVTFGWLGFIGGCDFKFSTSSLSIFANTLISAFVSGIVWTLIDYFYSSIPLESCRSCGVDTCTGCYKDPEHPLKPIISQTGVSMNRHAHESKSNFIQRRKISMISFTSGIMTGLVVITPAGGYVSSYSDYWKSFVFGVVGAVLCNLATRIKYFLKIDDALDLFAIHGVAGIVGSFLTGVFANQDYSSRGGWVHRNWKQVGYQLLGSVVAFAYCFILTCFFLYVIDLIPGLHLRIDKDFNRRIREMKKEKDTESQAPPTKMDFYEKVELLGSDGYEFNGEHMMDYMEFIRVIRPQDYQENEMFSEEYWNYGQSFTDEHRGHSSDFEIYSGVSKKES